MLQQEAAMTMIAGSQTHSVREDFGGQAIGLDIEFDGEGLETRGFDKKTGQQVVPCAVFIAPASPTR